MRCLVYNNDRETTIDAPILFSLFVCRVFAKKGEELPLLHKPIVGASHSCLSALLSRRALSCLLM